MMPDVIGTCYGKVEEFMEITPALWSIRESPMLPRRWESCGLCPLFLRKNGTGQRGIMRFNENQTGMIFRTGREIDMITEYLIKEQ